jgi:Zn-dependent protease
MQVFLLVVVLWVFSVCLHEFGHAFVAYKGGDVTVKDKGYLTMNPVHYTHPIYSLLMPVIFLMLGGLGLPGGAVYIEEHLLRSKNWRTAVALAGPAMNLLLAVVLSVPFWLGIVDEKFGPPLAFLIMLQVSSILFNLLPIPSLDGFNALAPFMSHETRARMMAHANTCLWILFLVMWNSRQVNRLFFELVFAGTSLLHIDPGLIAEGYREFRFWK